jgi:transcriptional regulator with XRE-family HTH domain
MPIFDYYNSHFMFEIITIKEVKVKIGTLCKAKRKEYGLTREQLAEELGMSRATIQNIESGKNATLDNLLKIANHFHLMEAIYKAIVALNSPNDNLSLY